MTAVVRPLRSPSRTSEKLSEVSSSNSLPDLAPRRILADQQYEVEDKRQSECALVLFARHTLTSERVVMKILRNYKDTRYSLETVGKRQQCQLEALQRNRVFTPEVYIGLAQILDLDLQQEHIHIDEIIRNPTKEMLDPNADYALLMHQLPENRRLDYLLKEEEGDSLRRHVRILAEHVGNVHTQLIPSLPTQDGVRWGGYEQLQRKLLHNFGLLDLVLTTSKNSQYSTYNWSSGTLDRLKDALLQVFMQSQYRYYFEQRVREQRIKRCHGDLKSPNIWILPYNHSCEGMSRQYVKILDAIDFNPSYSNVDILSDFAMLVIDVQTRTKSISLANEMIEYYLELTEQQDEIPKSVLGFYLVEKAIVGAAISIVYDNLPDLGQSLLEVAEVRLKCLVDRQY